MNERLDDTTMCEVLEAQASQFGAAARSLDAIEVELERAGWSDAIQLTLQQLIRNLTANASCAAAVKQWNQSDRRGSPRLKVAVEVTKSTLQKLLQRIDAVEATARRLKQRLEPRVDLAARTREAINAYRQSSGPNTGSQGETN